MPGPQLPIDIYLKLFRKCLRTRIPVEQFETYFSQLQSRSPLPATATAQAILDPTLTSNASDPLHLNYVSYLVSRDFVSLAQVLNVLRAISTKQPPSVNADGSVPATNGRETLEQDIFLALANTVRTRPPRSSETVWTAVQALTEWIDAVMAALGAGMMEQSDAETQMLGRLIALAELVVAVGTNPTASKILGETGRKEKKLAFYTALGSISPYIQPHNPELAQKLDTLKRSQQSSRTVRSQDAMEGVMMGLEEAGSTIPVVWSRYHVFVWLNGLLSRSPYLDEDLLITHLTTRYPDNPTELLTTFITGTLDLVSTAILRPEPPSILFLLRSFLVNKIPPLLSRLSPSPLTASYALGQAFLRGDVSPLINLPHTSFSSSSATQSDVFTEDVDLRQEFLFACALHGVIAESDIQGILGELPLSALPLSGLYNPQDLLNECSLDPTRVDRLLDELENMDGNSGAVCRALFAVIKNMAENRETMPLRGICNFLVRKPGRVDILLLFIRPEDLLDPLTTLLESWRYEEDQGEYQPVYEEFGSILLLVLTLHHLHRVPAPPPGSFLYPLLRPAAYDLSTLNEEEQAQLGGWIKELFENEGISDDLLASCLPQNFYRLLPTLLSQTLVSLTHGILDLDHVKECFTFLLSPFLLPSLVPGLIHLGHHLWRCTDPGPALALLELLAAAPQTADLETHQTHSTVLLLVAPVLHPILTSLGPRCPRDLLQRFTPRRPHRLATRDELTSWGGALDPALTTSLAAKHPTGLYPLPRQLAAARTLWGPQKVLDIVCTAVAQSDDAADRLDLALAALIGMGGDWWDGSPPVKHEGVRAEVERELRRRGREWADCVRSARIGPAAMGGLMMQEPGGDWGMMEI